MIRENFELHLANDIVQGEDIPFYLLWKDVKIKQINIKYSGFSGIRELYNVKEDFSTEKTIISINDLKRDGYLGGLLKTQKTDNPFKNGVLEIIVLKNDETLLKLFEERTLYTTCLQFIPPKTEEISFHDKPFLNIELFGSTTIFIDILTDDDSDLHLFFPPEIQTSIQKFIESFQSGLENLSQNFPNNPVIEVLTNIFNSPEKFTEQQYLEKAGLIIKKYEQDEKFNQAFAQVIFNAVDIESNLLNLVIKPLMEYFASSAAKKAFLNSPFLTLKILKGQNTFKGHIIYQNILEREDIRAINTQYNKVPFEIIVNSDEDRIVTVKDLISIERLENDSH